MSPLFAELWYRVIRERNADHYGIHGPQHWARVERNGLYLARQSGANEAVVMMFALFHDACRFNDSYDPGHGERGAAYARALRNEITFLDDPEFEILVFACTWHTDLKHHDDPTIQTCFDADRLDLGRVGITPHAKYLNTAAAKALVERDRLHLLEEEPVRTPPRPAGIR